MGIIEYKPYDFLREKAPEVELKVSLNTAYINFLFPTASLSSSPIFKVVVEILEYEKNQDGSINLEKQLSEKLVDFYPGQTSYAIQSPDKPFHSVIKSLNNNWYVFNFLYTYKPAPSNEGNNLFYSNQKTVVVDNTQPTIDEKTISAYLRGKFFERLSQIKDLTIWFSDIMQPKIGDIIYIDETNAKVVESINGIWNLPPYTLTQMDNSYSDINAFFRKNPDIKNTINTFFNNELPINGVIKFRIVFNSEIYYITLRGNIHQFYK